MALLQRLKAYRWTFWMVLVSCACAPIRSAGRCIATVDNFEGSPLLTLKGCKSNYDIGYAIGEAFRTKIATRLDESVAIKKIEAYASTRVGDLLVQAIFALNEQSYPDYWDEIRGLADGAGVSFEQVAMLNLRQEILTSAEPAPTMEWDACSDGLLSLRQSDGALRSWIGHNEDMTNDTLKHTYFVRHVGENVSWIAFTYAGEIVSPAFAVNSHGLVFTLNAVFPLRPWVPGVGRNFVSRHLLESASIDDALDIISQPKQGIGHSYNLAHLDSQHILNVESAPLGVIDVVNVTDKGWYFHANMYRHSDLLQRHDNSSIHRQAVADTYKDPASPGDVLYLLGDTSDAEWPIWRSGDGASCVYTLSTSLFDLQAGVGTIYTGNPRGRHAVMHIDLRTLEVSRPGPQGHHLRGSPAQ